jgi:hypothetical protein
VDDYVIQHIVEAERNTIFRVPSKFKPDFQLVPAEVKKSQIISNFHHNFSQTNRTSPLSMLEMLYNMPG